MAKKKKKASKKKPGKKKSGKKKSGKKKSGKKKSGKKKAGKKKAGKKKAGKKKSGKKKAGAKKAGAKKVGAKKAGAKKAGAKKVGASAVRLAVAVVNQDENTTSGLIYSKREIKNIKCGVVKVSIAKVYQGVTNFLPVAQYTYAFEFKNRKSPYPDCAGANRGSRSGFDDIFVTVVFVENVPDETVETTDIIVIP